MGLIADHDAAIRQAALDSVTYADYAEVNSVDRALKYVTALRKLIVGLPKTASYGGGQGEMVIQDQQARALELKRAEDFITRKRLAATQSMYFDTRHFRD